MAYAGFQRYEVPDIGGNVAKIMLAQQANDAKRDALKQANALKQAKLDNDKAKAEGKTFDENSKLISSAQKSLNEKLSGVPATGFKTADGAGANLATQHKQIALNAEKKLKETGNRNEFNTTINSALRSVDEMKKSYDGLAQANTKMSTAKNPDPLSQEVIRETFDMFTGADGSPIATELQLNENGEVIPHLLSFEKGEDGSQSLKSKMPLSSVNSIIALSNYDKRDFAKEMVQDQAGLGKYEEQVKSGNGTVTILNPKGQENFNRAKELYVNSVLFNERDKVAAYMELVNDPSKRTILVNKDASQAIKDRKAKDAGYENYNEANKIEFSYDKDGLVKVDFPKEKEDELRKALDQAYDDRSPYKKSLSLGSKNSTNVTIYNQDAQNTSNIIEEGFDLNDPTGYKSAVAVLNTAKNRGQIMSYKFIRTAPKGLTEEKRKAWYAMKDKGLIAEDAGELTNDIEIVQKAGGTNDKPLAGEPIIINALSTNPKEQQLYRSVMGYSGDAAGYKNQKKNTYTGQTK